LRPLLRWPDRQQAALAFDHDIAGIGCRRGYQSNPPPAVIENLVPDIFRASPGFAKAAAGKKQPCAPLSHRRELIAARPPRPVMFEGL
jgi:hypothetical protein